MPARRTPKLPEAPRAVRAVALIVRAVAVLNLWRPDARRITLPISVAFARCKYRFMRTKYTYPWIYFLR